MAEQNSKSTTEENKVFQATLEQFIEDEAFAGVSKPGQMIHLTTTHEDVAKYRAKIAGYAKVVAACKDFYKKLSIQRSEVDEQGWALPMVYRFDKQGSLYFMVTILKPVEAAEKKKKKKTADANPDERDGEKKGGNRTV